MDAPFEEDVLDVEASDVDCLYRIARHTGTVARVLYVTVCDASFIPEHERTESSLILRNLRKLSGWNDLDWHTMKVLQTEAGICTEKDQKVPHALSNETLLTRMPRVNIFDVEVLDWPKHRTSRARIDEKDVFMKIAPFSYQLRYLRHEVMMYHYLLGENLAFGPELLGYVYEETPDCVIGFLCQAINGRHPLDADYDLCMNALKNLHAKGIHHGDINKFNILITPGNEVVFIDFENSTPTATSTLSDIDIATMMQTEKHGLHNALLDQSNRGRPLGMSD